MRETRPTVACVIATHGRSRLLVDAIETVASQTRPPEEVLVVDDVGDADTAAAVIDASTTFGLPIRHLSNPDQGASSSRNLGAEQSDSDLIAFLDDDDCWHSHFLEKAVDMIEQKGVDLVATGLVPFRVGSVAPTRVPRAHVQPSEALGSNPGVTGSNFVIRSAVFAKLQGFDVGLRVSNDKDFFFRFVDAGFSYEVIPEGLAFQRSHETSRLTKNSAERVEALHAYKRKWEERLSPDDRRVLEEKILRVGVRSATSTRERVLLAAKLLRMSGPRGFRFERPKVWTAPTPDMPRPTLGPEGLRRNESAPSVSGPPAAPPRGGELDD